MVVTKDKDLVRLLEAHGAPPQVVRITVGNVRNPVLHALWARGWRLVEQQVGAGEPLVELGDLPCCVCHQAVGSFTLQDPDGVAGGITAVAHGFNLSSTSEAFHSLCA